MYTNYYPVIFDNNHDQIWPLLSWKQDPRTNNFISRTTNHLRNHLRDTMYSKYFGEQFLYFYNIYAKINLGNSAIII